MDHLPALQNVIVKLCQLSLHNSVDFPKQTFNKMSEILSGAVGITNFVIVHHK